jgi:hypothetical protein
MLDRNDDKPGIISITQMFPHLFCIFILSKYIPILKIRWEGRKMRMAAGIKKLVYSKKQ